MGWNWLKQVRLNWQNIFSLQRSDRQAPSSTVSQMFLSQVLERNNAVFAEGLATYTGPSVQIRIDPNFPPKFCQSRPVPYAHREAVEEELAHLEAEGIIERVTHSEWALPIVTVMKSDGSFRLCGDYKRTVNPALIVDHYPLPQINDMFAKLAGCKRFTKIDLSQAYLQLTLDEASRKYTTVNTIKGLFQFRRMPFGIASASAIFQQLSQCCRESRVC